MRDVQHEPPPEIGMLMKVPAVPAFVAEEVPFGLGQRYRGDSFTVTVRANTAGFFLEGWRFTLDYDDEASLFRIDICVLLEILKIYHSQ